MTEVSWTKEELNAFKKLIDAASSRDQMSRISGRIDMNKFVTEHGKEKCDAMFAHLEKKVKP